jgi:NACHT domain
VSFVHDRAAKQELIDDITSRLSPRIATNFHYVDQGRACCNPATRIEILAKIEDWAYDMSDDSPRLFWLTGVPGAGKSSIGASIARTFDDKNFLRAQFFISRSHPSTTDPNRIFPSIAHQLAKFDRKVAEAINAALEKQKSLANNITDDQARKLFVEPINVISGSHPSDPILVVIDAIDEIEGDVSETTKIISDAIMALPRNAKVLISSRPEHGIQLHFSPLVSKESAAHLDLDTSHPLSMQDVSRFFRSEIKKILRTYLSEMEQWPGEERMQMLCDRASGLFIWAVTAVGYIRTCIEAEGSQCLDDVLDDLNTGGKHGINKLYSTILQRTFASDEDGRQSEIFRRVVGALVTLQEPLPLIALRSLLDLHCAGRHRSIDVKHFICRFRSVLVAGTGDIDETTVPRLHKSFIEFVTKACDNRFRVDKKSSSMALAVQCFRQLNSLRRDMCEIEHMAKFNADIPDLSLRIERHLSVPFRYACRFWAIHLSRSEGREDTIRRLFRDFFYEHLLHWVEVMSLLDYSSVFSLLERAAEWEYVRSFSCRFVSNNQVLILPCRATIMMIKVIKCS